MLGPPITSFLFLLVHKQSRPPLCWLTHLPGCTPWGVALLRISPWPETPWALVLPPAPETWPVSSLFPLLGEAAEEADGGQRTRRQKMKSPAESICGLVSEAVLKKISCPTSSNFSDRWSRGLPLCPDLYRVWDCVKAGGHHFSNWASIMCTWWGNLITSLPKLAPTGWLLTAGYWSVTPPPQRHEEVMTSKPKNQLLANYFSQEYWQKHTRKALGAFEGAAANS